MLRAPNPYEREFAKLPIPSVGSSLKEPIAALIRASDVLRQAFDEVLEGADPREVMEEREDMLLQAEAVIGRWSDHLGLTVEALLADLDGEDFRADDGQD